MLKIQLYKQILQFQNQISLQGKCWSFTKQGPTTLLRATCAPLNHYFIPRIFLEFLKYVFQKNMNLVKNLNTIMLRCILKNIKKYVIKKYFQIVLFNVKTILNYFYAVFKLWLQEVKSPCTYFSLIRLIPYFYEMYIMYSQYIFI